MLKSAKIKIKEGKSMGKQKIELSERKKQILIAIVEAHIRLGEPVGSKYLMQEAGIPYSSATIRNEMAELEELGYLEKTHTSSGRIPSELGYRFYVDNLVSKYDSTKREEEALERLLTNKRVEVEKLLEKATQLASSLTNYTALSLRPRAGAITIRRYETIYLDPYSFILVMVAFMGDVVKTANIKLPFSVDSQTIGKLADVLNNNLANTTIEQINVPVMMKMESELEGYEELVSIVVKSIYETMNQLSSEVKFEGVNRLLEYPEYSDLDKLQKMISTIENKSDIIEAVSNIDQSDDEIKVFIGSENMVEIMDGSTLIYKNLKLGGKTIGAIGIIGPCRMDYSKVLATIDKLAYEISTLTDLPLLPQDDNDDDEE